MEFEKLWLLDSLEINYLLNLQNKIELWLEIPKTWVTHLQGK